MAKEIQLTQGNVAIVSDEDYEWLMQWKWHTARMGNMHKPYVKRGLNTKSGLSMHRAVMGRYVEIPPKMVVDHINGNTLDNRRENLRVVTHSENIRNQRGHSDGTSPFKGVAWNAQKQRWQVMIGVNGTGKSYGFYESPVIAAVFANDIFRQRDGVFARLSEIPFNVELLARQVPYANRRGRKSKQVAIAQLEHAERVERAYSEWLIMKRITDWLAEAPPTASANAAAANGSRRLLLIALARLLTFLLGLTQRTNRQIVSFRKRLLHTLVNDVSESNLFAALFRERRRDYRDRMCRVVVHPYLLGHALVLTHLSIYLHYTRICNIVNYADLLTKATGRRKIHDSAWSDSSARKRAYAPCAIYVTPGANGVDKR